MIKKYIKRHKNPKNNKKKDSGKNGAISTIAQLSCPIRFFTGGDPYDILVAHGISHMEVYRSI
jgi:hypothetical protein